MHHYDEENYPTVPPGIDGVLFYLAEGNTGTIQLAGNPESYFAGLIFAPDGNVDLSGTSDLETPFEFFTQVVAKNVFIGGTADVNITFDENLAPTVPNVMELYK